MSAITHLLAKCTILLFVFCYSIPVLAIEHASVNYPQRIIALAPHTVELLFTLGVGDRIVATTDFSDYPEAAKDIPRIGNGLDIQIERALELEPDLVIVWDGGNKEQDIKQLEQFGLEVYHSNINSIDEIADELIRLGKIMGVRQKSLAIADAYKKQLHDIRAANMRKAPVSFFYQLWFEPLKTITADSWVNELLRSCGGVNIFRGGRATEYPQVSMENILIGAPQVIVIPSHQGSAMASSKIWQKWPEIPAVKNHHIVYINGDILHRFSTRVLEGMQAVCEAFDQARPVDG